MNKVKQAYISDVEVEKKTPAGDTVKEKVAHIRGAKCPQCGAFHAMAIKVHCCGKCNYGHTKSGEAPAPKPYQPKPWQIKRENKRLLREQKEKENAKKK